MSEDTRPRTFYLGLIVRKELNALARMAPEASTYFFAADGRRLSVHEAAAALTIALAKGHQVFPSHPKCGQPCQHSNDCKGFDYKGGGCAGHPSGAQHLSTLPKHRNLS